MKKLILLMSVLVLAGAPAGYAAEEDSLSAALENLNSPSNEAPVSVAEKMYSIQDRFTPLKGRVGTTAMIGQKLSDTGFIQSREVGASLRYYFSSKWSLGLNGSYVFNQMSSSADQLYKAEGLIPDVPYVKYRADLSARYNLFYGKFRLSMDKVLYFDQYVSVGPAMVATQYADQTSANSLGGVADIGLAFWMGQNWTAHFGLKDYVVPDSKSNSLTNQMMVYLELGYLFGKGV